MKRVYLLSGLVCIAFSAQTQQLFPDCSFAYVACSKDPILIGQAAGPGETDEIVDADCFGGGFPETNSAWIKWKIDLPGTLGFTILPFDESDDIDFVLYKLDNGLQDCSSKTIVRCMASGENRGASQEASSSPCTGATGLNGLSKDERELPGCAKKDDNFLAEIDTEKGEFYALFVHNYFSSGGFLIEFTGICGFEDMGGLCSPSAVGSSQEQLEGAKVSVGTPFPNPAYDRLFFPLASEEEYPQALIQLITLQGNVVREEMIRIASGEQLISISLEELPTGIFFLKTSFAGFSHVSRFIVK